MLLVGLSVLQHFLLPPLHIWAHYCPDMGPHLPRCPDLGHKSTFKHMFWLLPNKHSRRKVYICTTSPRTTAQARSSAELGEWQQLCLHVSHLNLPSRMKTLSFITGWYSLAVLKESRITNVGTLIQPVWDHICPHLKKTPQENIFAFSRNLHSVVAWPWAALGAKQRQHIIKMSQQNKQIKTGLQSCF